MNIGEGEPTWPRILADARAGASSRVMAAAAPPTCHPHADPAPRDLYRNEHYDWDEDLVQLTRGCPTPAGCARFRRRWAGASASGPSSGWWKNFARSSTRTSIWPTTRSSSRTEVQRIRPRVVPRPGAAGKEYFVSSTLALNTDPEFLDLAARAGVRNFYCTLNVDPVSIRALKGEPRERQMLDRSGEGHRGPRHPFLRLVRARARLG